MEVKPRWTVVSDGRSLTELVASLERHPNWRIGLYAQEILSRTRIKIAPSAIHDLVVIKGEEVGPQPRRTTENILREARRRGFATPSPEAALLLREAFPQEALGYSRVIFFHKPLRDRDHHPALLTLHYPAEDDPKGNRLIALEAYPQTMWKPTDAFVFLAPQKPLHKSARPVVNRRNRSRREPNYARLAWRHVPM